MQRVVLLLGLALIAGVPGSALAQGTAADEEAPGDVVPEEGGADEIFRVQEKMAALYEGKDDLRSALKIWRELLAREPRRVSYLAQVARLALLLQDYPGALDPARQLVAMVPQDGRYRLQLVEALAGAGRKAEALPHLLWLHQRPPAAAEARKLIAELLEELQRPAEALVHLDWLIARAPRQGELRVARAGVYADLRQEPQQIAELQAAVRLLPRPQGAELHRQLAELYLSREDFARAEEHALATQRALPDDVRARELLVTIRGKRQAAQRREIEEWWEAERYQDWLIDLQERADDF